MANDELGAHVQEQGERGEGKGGWGRETEGKRAKGAVARGGGDGVGAGSRTARALYAGPHSGSKLVFLLAPNVGAKQAGGDPFSHMFGAQSPFSCSFGSAREAQ